MDTELVVYGILVAVGILAVAWFVFVLPSERRDHERRLENIRKRIAAREEGNEQADSEDLGTGRDGN